MKSFINNIKAAAKIAGNFVTKCFHQAFDMINKFISEGISHFSNGERAKGMFSFIKAILVIATLFAVVYLISALITFIVMSTLTFLTGMFGLSNVVVTPIFATVMLLICGFALVRLYVTNIPAHGNFIAILAFRGIATITIILALSLSPLLIVLTMIAIVYLVTSYAMQSKNTYSAA